MQWKFGSPPVPCLRVSWTLSNEVARLPTVEAEICGPAVVPLLWGQLGPPDLHGLCLVQQADVDEEGLCQ